ncbi:MAG: hypothetical protein WBD31_05420 [Rubripirellula sp.]
MNQFTAGRTTGLFGAGNVDSMSRWLASWHFVSMRSLAGRVKDQGRYSSELASQEIHS